MHQLLRIKPCIEHQLARRLNVRTISIVVTSVVSMLTSVAAPQRRPL
jgi:hypothetical protein